MGKGDDDTYGFTDAAVKDFDKPNKSSSSEVPLNQIVGDGITLELDDNNDGEEGNTQLCHEHPKPFQINC